jgi:hypothetical protein
MPKGSIRVTKARWYAAGGLTNPRCWRRQQKDGRWIYYLTID